MTREEATALAKRRFEQRELMLWKFSLKRPGMKASPGSRAVKWDDCTPEVQEAEIRKVLAESSSGK